MQQSSANLDMFSRVVGTSIAGFWVKKSAGIIFRRKISTGLEDVVISSLEMRGDEEAGKTQKRI